MYRYRTLLRNCAYCSKILHVEDPSMAPPTARQAAHWFLITWLKSSSRLPNTLNLSSPWFWFSLLLWLPPPDFLLGSSVGCSWPWLRFSLVYVSLDRSVATFQVFRTISASILLFHSLQPPTQVLSLSLSCFTPWILGWLKPSAGRQCKTLAVSTGVACLLMWWQGMKLWTFQCQPCLTSLPSPGYQREFLPLSTTLPPTQQSFSTKELKGQFSMKFLLTWINVALILCEGCSRHKMWYWFWRCRAFLCSQPFQKMQSIAFIPLQSMSP